MTIILYQLPFWLIGLHLLFRFYSLAKKRHYKDKVRFWVSTIPIFLIALAFWFGNSNFNALYVPWMIYFMFIVLNMISTLIIIDIREKKSNQKVDDFGNHLHSVLKSGE